MPTGSCVTGPEFWVSLPAAIAAAGAFIASIRTGRRTEVTAEKVDEHRRESKSTRAAFDAVIKQLEPRVRNGEKGHP